MSPLRGALIGFGQVAEKAHAPAYRGSPDFEIIAATDVSAERLLLAEGVFPGLRTYASLEALLEAERTLDFIDIASPPFLHARQAHLALKRGLHVLCEKPLTLDAARFEELEALSVSSGRVLYTVDNWAHAPIWAKALEMAASGALGEVRHAELHVLRRGPAAGAACDWRKDAKIAGGGILVDHGWHNLYLLRRLLAAAAGGVAEAPTSVVAQLDGAPVEDTASVFIQFPSATALIHLTWKASERSNWAVFYGARGRLELRDGTIILKTADKPAQETIFPEKLSASSAHPAWFTAMLSDFKAETLEPARRGENQRQSAFIIDVISRAYRRDAQPVAA